MWKFNSVTGKWEFIPNSPGSRAYNEQLTNQAPIGDDSNVVDTMQRILERKRIMSDPNLDETTRQELEAENTFDPYSYKTEESNREALLQGDPKNDQYFKYLNKAKNRFGKEFLTTEDPYKSIALDQGIGEQFGRKVGNLLPNIALGIVESIGYLGELPGAILGNDRDFSNGLTEWAKAGKDDIFGEVYRMNPNETVDLSDSGWWINNGFDLVESIGEFAVTGFGIGSGLSKIAKGISTAAKLGQTGSKILNVGLANIPTSAALAYTEGAMSGSEIYKQVYEDVLRRTGNEEYAKQEASNSAATTVGLNTAINTALNLYSVGAMFTNPSKSALLSQKFGFNKFADEGIEAYATRLASMPGEYMPSKMRTLSKYMVEAPMESAEELVNVFAEKRGRVRGGLEESKGWVDDLIESAKSDEGLLSMALGALGGIGNIAVMNNLPSIEKADNKLGLKFGESARQKELNQNKTVYAAQINALKDDLTDFVVNKDELQKAVQSGDLNKINEAKDKLFNIGLNRAIVEGNADSMIATLEEIASVDNTSQTLGPDGKTDAMRQGLAENMFDTSYKELANKKITKVKELAEEFKTIENSLAPKELEAPGFIRHVSKANVNYSLANDALDNAISNYSVKLANYESLKSKLQAAVIDKALTEEEQTNILDISKSTFKDLAESKEFKELNNAKLLVEASEKNLKDATKKYKEAQDFDAYKKSLEKSVEDIESSKGKSQGEDVLNEIAKKDLDTKLSEAGYQRTGKVGEFFVFNKEGKNFIAERVQTPKGSKVYIKDPTTGKYSVDSKGINEEFTLDYYSKNSNIAIIPKQQYLNERKEEIVARSKKAQSDAIESVILGYEDKLQRVKDLIPEYELTLKNLNEELEILKKDIDKLLQKNRQSKLSKKDIKDRIKQINKAISETNDKLNTAREARENIEKSIKVLTDFKIQLQFIPKNEMVSFTDVLKDTQFVLDSSVDDTESKLKEISNSLEDIIFNLKYRKDRLEDLKNILEDLLSTDDIISALVTKNIMDATFLNKYPDFPAHILQNPLKLLDSDLNRLAVINYKRRRAAGQNLPFRVVKDQLFTDLSNLADISVSANIRQKLESDLNTTLSELKAVSDRIDAYSKQYLDAKEKQQDIKILKDQFEILDKHITVLANRYSKELAKSERNDTSVDKSQQAGDTVEITPLEESKEKFFNDSFLSDFIFYTTGRNLRFDENGTIYDLDGNPVFEEGYQQRWFKFLDKNSNLLEGDEDEPIKYSLKVFVRNAKGTPSELNKLMNEEVGDKVNKDSIDLGVFLIDEKGEYVKVNEKGDKDTNGIPAFTFLPRLDSLLPKDKDPKVTWSAITNLYLRLHNVSIPSVKNKKDDDMVKFQGEDITVKEMKDILITEARNYYGNFVNKIVNSEAGVELQIAGVTNGIALRKKDKDGITKVQSLEQLLKSSDTEIKQIHVSKFGQATTIKGISYQYDPGTVLVELDNGAVFPVHTTTLSKEDVDTSLYLISQGKYSFSQEIPYGTFQDKEGKTREKFSVKGSTKVRIFPKNRSEKYSLLGNLMTWGKYNVNAKNKDFEIYIDNGYVHFKDVTNNYNSIRLHLDDVLNDTKNIKLKEFLAQKRYNVSTSAINSSAKYFHPYIKDGKVEFKEYKSYEDYLVNKIKTFTFVSKDGQMMASKNIIIATGANGIPLIKNPEIKSSKTVVKEVKTPSYEDPEVPVEVPDEVGEGTSPQDFGFDNWQDIDPETMSKNIRMEGKIVRTTQQNVDKEFQESSKKVKKISMDDSIDGVDTPVEDPYYGLTKEEWENLSEKERETIIEQKKDCEGI